MTLNRSLQLLACTALLLSSAWRANATVIAPAGPAASRPPAPAASVSPELGVFRLADACAPTDALGPVMVYLQHAAEYSFGPTRSAYFQSLGWALSRAGDTEGALEAYDRAYPPKLLQAGSHFQVTATPAVAGIVDLARAHPVLMINEAHHVPETRMLTRELLAPLRKLGFRYLAVETLNEWDTTLMQRGYPLAPTTGYYTAEPVYADMIREAVKLGYTLVPYEAHDFAATHTPGIAVREAGQARNLYERIFKHDPHAKVLVHVGYDHLDKRLSGRDIWLAARLKGDYGIDPLSIDQTTLLAHPDQRYESPNRQALLSLLQPTGPVLLQPRGRSTWRDMGVSTGADYLVLAPRPTFVQGRPAWLLAMPDRQLVPPPTAWAALERGDFPMVAQAYYRNERGARVPADSYLVPARRWFLPFVLGPGAYDLALTDAKGATRHAAVTVPARP